MEKNFDITLICGYRTHGKDFFFKKLDNKVNNKFICLYQDEKKLNHFKKLKNHKRIAFADCLKQDLEKIDKIEENKDKKVYRKNINNDYIIDINPEFSGRDIYIDYAKSMKEKDINYWVKRAIFNLDINCSNIITDWRFQHEYDYMIENSKNILTIRIFNFEKVIPCKNVESEHDLDNFSTDFLIIPFEQIENLENIYKIFPNYSEYKFKYIF